MAHIQERGGRDLGYEVSRTVIVEPNNSCLPVEQLISLLIQYVVCIFSIVRTYPEDPCRVGDFACFPSA